MTAEQRRIEEQLEQFFGRGVTTRVNGDLYTGAIELVRGTGSIGISLHEDVECRVINLSALARNLAP